MERYQGVTEHVNAHERMRRRARAADTQGGRQRAYGRGMGYLRTAEFERQLADEIQDIRQRYTVPGQVLDFAWTDEEEPTNE